MLHFIDPDRFLSQAINLRDAILAAIAHPRVPRLSALRRKLIRLEGDIIFWLLWPFHSAPEGTFAVGARRSNASPPTHTNQPRSTNRISEPHAFALHLSNTNPAAQNKARYDYPFRPKPTRAQTLDKFMSRWVSLICVLCDPEPALIRIARKLAHTKIIPVLSRALVTSTNTLIAQGFFDSKSQAPKPHPRE